METTRPRIVLHVLETARLEGSAIAKIVAALADHLPREKYELHACFLGNDGPLAHELKRHGANVSVLNWTGGVRDPAGALRFALCLRRLGVSIVHLHTGGRSVTWLSRWISRAPVIFHLHAMLNESDPGRPIVIHKTEIEAVIANSRATAGTVDHPRVTVIYPGIEPKPPTGSPPAETPQTIGAAGRLVRVKGIAVLIEAFALLAAAFPDVRLEIAGSGPESQTLKNEVKQLGLEKRVRLLGWVDELPKAFGQWTIFAQPSFSEGFGISVLEAMANKLPVVATNVGGIPELVADGVSGLLVPPGDPPAFATALKQLLVNPERRRAMGERGADRARQEFPASLMASRVEELYDTLTAASAASVPRSKSL